jgi:hypothetical protein
LIKRANDIVINNNNNNSEQQLREAHDKKTSTKYQSKTQTREKNSDKQDRSKT